MRCLRALCTALAVAAVLVASAGASPALAHVEIREADPAPGDVVDEGRDSISITFLAFDPDGPVSIEITDPAGTDVTAGEPEIDARNGTVQVATQPLEVGEHIVHWHAQADDGDGESEGTYTFTVEASPTTGIGIWAVWFVALAIPAAIFLRPGARRRPAGGTA